MKLKSLRHQVLSLAAAYQVCDQVKSVAWKGKVETSILDTAVGSIFKLESDNLEDVYGGKKNIVYGLNILSREFNPSIQSKPDSELTRYMLSLFLLEKKLAKQPKIINRIQKAISAATTQLEHFGLRHPNTLAALADIYQQTIGTLSPRIMVAGEQIHLSNESNASRIRTLLLAGLRSVVLWRQCGGNRLKLLIWRKDYFHEASSILAS